MISGPGLARFSSIRTLVAFVLISHSYLSVRAQDLIVLASGDSLNCKIRGTDKQGIHYDSFYKGELSSNYRLLEQVASVQKGFYKVGLTEGLSRSTLRPFPIYRLSVFGGIGQRFHRSLENPPGWVKEIEKELSAGYTYGFQAYYFPWKNWGFGLHFQRAHYSGSSDAVDVLM